MWRVRQGSGTDAQQANSIELYAIEHGTAPLFSRAEQTRQASAAAASEAAFAGRQAAAAAVVAAKEAASVVARLALKVRHAAATSRAAAGSAMHEVIVPGVRRASAATNSAGAACALAVGHAMDALISLFEEDPTRPPASRKASAPGICPRQTRNTQREIRAQNLLEILSVSMDNTEVENASESLRRQLDNRPYGNSTDAVNNHCVAWARAGAIDAVLDALRNHPRSERLALSGLSLLKQLSSCKWTRYLVPYSGAQRINKHGGVDAILKIMLMFNPSSEQNLQDPAGLGTDDQALLQEQACRLLCNLAHHNQDIRTKIWQKSVEKTVKEVMEVHSNKPGVQDAGQDLLDRLYDMKNEKGHTH